MVVRHPFDGLGETQRIRGLWWTGIIALLLGLVVTLEGSALRIAGVEGGILSLEFAGSLEAVETIRALWEAENLVGTARWNLVLDYGFLLSYSTFLTLVVLRAVMAAGRGWWFRLGAALVWGQWLAGLSDAIENTALLALTASVRSDLLARIAWNAAVLKFALIAGGIAYVVGVVLVCGLRRLISRPDS